MRTPTRLLTTAALAAAITLPLIAAPVSAADPGPSTRSPAAIDAATAYLITQQQPDGGFEVAGFPGFETPDAVLALAAAGQSGTEWDEGQARAAVEAVRTSGEPALDALDAIDDWVDSVQSDPGSDAAARAQQAAKVIVLVTEPLGLSATDFDPSGDSAEPVDLAGALTAARGPAGDFAALTFTGRAFATWALAATGANVPAALLDAIAAAQQANGSFDFSGDPRGSGFDPDVTAIVVSALAEAGRPASDPVVRRAVVGLAFAQRSNGEWAGGFDDGNPNSTAVVMLAAASLGSDPDSACWRVAADVRLAGVQYPRPRLALERRQAPDGHIASPFDDFGVNTFATSQSIQALVAAEGPWPHAPATACTSSPPAPNRRLVNGQFADLLGRLTDEAGARYWVGRLDGGASPAQVSRQLTGTGEYGRKVTDRIFRSYLGRPATSAERSYGQQTVLAGRRLDLAAAILGNTEYYDSTAPPFTGEPATNATWVEAVYLDALGRPVRADERDFVLAALTRGSTRGQVARSLLGSTEGLNLLVNDIYRQLLRRNADVAGRDYWVGEIRRGRSPEGLVTLIAGSSEYVNKTTAAV